ncbi:MAG: quinate 5-dehydrogenase [Anaerolineales bacterium]
MKRAVSISIGSSKRDKAVEVNLLGETVRIERIGTNGDMEKAAQLFKELDGKVDAFGLGGADLGLLVDKKFYRLYSVNPIVRFVKQTPLVDGEGIKNTLENKAIGYFHEKVKDYVKERKALITSGADRWGMTRSFLDAGYECVFGDLMFALGIPIPLRSEQSIKTLAAAVMPVVGRLPFKWLYPTGEKQEMRTPKWEKYYEWASVIAGDFHFIKRHIPESLPGKVILTNTTTPDDVELLRRIGIKYLVTTTPVFDGRSFGTNMLEAALIAVSAKGRKLTHDELRTYIDELKLEPQIQELN